MQRPDGIDYRQSLRRLMEKGDLGEIEAIANRQARTVDAMLSRMHSPDLDDRRELVLLADEVGLGKTFVALGVAWSVLLHRLNSGLPRKPILIVTPSSQALFNKWQRDVETFLKEVVPAEPKIQVIAVERPHELIDAMRTRKLSIVIARMSAIEGQLYQYDVAIAATLHTLFNYREPSLNVDQRLQLVAAWPAMRDREAVDLRGSKGYWTDAENTPEVGFGAQQVRGALRRLERISPNLVHAIDASIKRARNGEAPRADFANSVKELARAAMGETYSGALPLVIVDEIHNWKNHPKSWRRFLHLFGGRIDRVLGLSATPFQLGPHELINLLDLRQCLRLDDDRRLALDKHVDALQKHLERAQQAGARLSEAWTQVRPHDVADIEAAWVARSDGLGAVELPSRIDQALRAATAVKISQAALMKSLRPFLLRHRRDTRHRRWRVGCDADASLHDERRWVRTLSWRPGLDVSGDGELVHYLMMRAMQECKDGKGATSLGSDLGGSYDYFRQHELKRLRDMGMPSAQRYIDLVDLAVGQSRSDGHPKVRVTTERAFNAWLQGEKTLVFCFNPLTVDALREAISQRVRAHERDVLTNAFGCLEDEYERRLENFQKRLYNYRQSVFLLFQDHPLAGSDSRVPSDLALTEDDLAQIAHKLASGGPPRDRSRFDRRRVLAATEQVLIARWQAQQIGMDWLAGLFPTDDDCARRILWDEMLSPEWPALRRSRVEGVQREAEAEPFQEDEESDADLGSVDPVHETAWREILSSKTGRAVLAPYLPDDVEVPSLLTRWHARELHGLPSRHRALATRMLRRIVGARLKLTTPARSKLTRE